MVFFPVICIDGFFPNTNHIRDYALTADNLNWGSCPDGRWPGVRSRSLNEVNESLFREIADRYLMNLYSKDQLDNVSYFVQMYFQKIDGEYNGGWIHVDYPHLHSTIIYLTPSASLSSGTSLYQPKNSVIASSVVEKYRPFKNKLYRKEISCEEAEEYRIKNNDSFEKITSFSNIYNRCIGFDGNVWHSADEFNKNEERLTIIIFWEKINGPLQTSNQLP